MWDLKMKKSEPFIRHIPMANHPAEGKINKLNSRMHTALGTGARNQFMT
jgi:Na+-transporting NADH:ubiquinone oxidoreductase subunit NqrF